VMYCPTCQRPAYLWRGEFCDVCTPDSDGNGVDDRTEGPRAPDVPTLFPIEEKGWAMVGPPRWRGNTKEVVREWVRQWHEGRARRREEAMFRAGIHPELQPIEIPSESRMQDRVKSLFKNPPFVFDAIK
jgi:hypothetical protein